MAGGGRIRDEDIALVRERSSIVDVVSEQVTLKPAGGGNLKGLCPFHDEKTPSFTVAQGRNVYFCHGCGEGGDVINFVQKIDHLTFVEAVERLADRAGIVLRRMEAGPAPVRPAGQRQRLVEAHKAAQAFYAEQLLTPGARAAREFLAARG
uniref:CHC2 zinc finger domain-containing protein n=1 Tax=Allorhizocola rhizosphaerae TaxID=1872709 RepID=UPI001FE9DBF6